MKLLFAIAISSHDAERAERLLDFIHHHSGRRGHLVLGLMSEVHDEMKARIRISASLAFEVVHEVALRPFGDRSAPRQQHCNNAFRQMAAHIQSTFSWPWMWLEADCSPMIVEWRLKLWEAYDSQPMEFFGNRMRINPKKEGESEFYFMARVGIYPRDAYTKMTLAGSDSNAPFEIASGKSVVARMTATKLIQHVTIKTDADLLKLRDDAILIHGDKANLLLDPAQLMGTPIPEPVKMNFQESVPIPAAEPDVGGTRVTQTMLRELLKNGARK